MPVSNGSLVIAFKPKAKENLCMAAILLFCFLQRKSLKLRNIAHATIHNIRAQY
jgi:hypothetical protein